MNEDLWDNSEADPVEDIKNFVKERLESTGFRHDGYQTVREDEYGRLIPGIYYFDDDEFVSYKSMLQKLRNNFEGGDTDGG